MTTKIGEESYGTVFNAVKKEHASHVPNGRTVACKHMKRMKPVDLKFGRFVPELEAWKYLSHRNILRAEDILLDDDYVYVIKEKLDLDVTGLMDVYSEIQLDVNQKYVIRQILEGL